MDKGEFLAIVMPVAELVEKKSGDYQGRVVQLEEYFPFKDKSYVQMIWTKALRLLSLVTRELIPKFESVEDTVDDMIAYLVFYKKYLQETRAMREQARGDK